MLLELFTQFNTQQPKRICILGPGLFQEGDLISFPQFFELLSLFPHAEFLLLDNDEKALELMKQQLMLRQVSSYDPLTFMYYSFQTEGVCQHAPQKFAPLFSKMRDVFIEKGTSEKNISRMLQGKEEAKPLHLKVDPTKIQIRHFDINKDTCNGDEKKSFDLIVATLSMSLAIKQYLNAQPDHNPFFTLVKFLSMLKENGILYVDLSHIIEIFEKNYGPKGWELGVRYLEVLLGNKLMIRSIPLSDFLPDCEESGLIINPTIFQRNRKKEQETRGVSTCSLAALRRSSEKATFTKEEERSIILQMGQLLKPTKEK